MCLAVPGKILSISGDDELTRSGRIDFGGVVKETSLVYVPEARTDDYVLVHVGFALAVIDEAEAARVFELLQQLEEPATTQRTVT
ncbi:MAG: HypC/HybG/HupF family hydrogenase formation chaperone [Burkholderiales bacterium]|jgi:hydrogenase expression/formation protein HypC